MSGRAARAFAGAGVVTAAYGFSAAVRIALVPVLTRTLPVEVFSSFTLLSVATPALVTLSDLGCGIALVRELATEHDPAARRVLIATALGGRAVFGAAISLAIVLGSGFAQPEMASALRLGAGAVFCFGLSLTAQDALRGLERYGAAAVSQVAGTSPAIAALVSTILFKNQSLSGLLAAILGGSIAELLVTIGLLASNFAARPSLRVYRGFLKLGLFVAAYFGLRSALAFDRHVVGYRTTLDQAGFFQLASAPAGGIDLIEMAGIAVAEPYIYGVADEERPRSLERITRAFGFVLIAAAATLSFAAPELLLVLAPKAYEPALAALPGLTFAAAGRSMARVVGLGAGIARQTRVWAIAAAAHVVVSLSAVALIVPRYGLAGAAAVEVVTSAAAVVLTYVLTRQIWPGAAVLRRAVAIASLSIVFGGALTTLLASRTLGMLAPAWLRAVLLFVFVVAVAVLFVRGPAHAARRRSA